MVRLLLIVIPLAVTIYALIDAANTDKSEVRRLPRWLWLLAIFFLPLVGAILWFSYGRPRKQRPAANQPSRWQESQKPPQGPDDDPEFLKGL